MAANLDKSESSLSAVSDVAYVRALDSSGNSVKISKSDLASVLGATKNYGNVSAQTSANTLITNGIYGNIMGRMTDVPAGTWGLLIVFFGGNNYTLQLYLNVDGGASSAQYALWYRTIAGDSIFAWKKIAVV